MHYSLSYFNPRSHCRERLFFRCVFIRFVNFNPRSHCRERQIECQYHPDREGISIHVPIAGNDVKINADRMADLYISIHVPIAGNDSPRANIFSRGEHFNPRSHCRERPSSSASANSYFNFNPRSHCRERLRKARRNSEALEFQSTFPLQGTTGSRIGG